MGPKDASSPFRMSQDCRGSSWEQRESRPWLLMSSLAAWTSQLVGVPCMGHPCMVGRRVDTSYRCVLKGCVASTALYSWRCAVGACLGCAAAWHSPLAGGSQSAWDPPLISPTFHQFPASPARLQIQRYLTHLPHRVCNLQNMSSLRPGSCWFV